MAYELTEEQVEEFQRQGFLNGGQVIDEATADELCAELERVIAEQDDPSGPQPVLLSNLGGDDAHPVWQVVNIWQASPAYRRLISEPSITSKIAQLSGASELRVWHDQIQFKPAATGGVNMWHQDDPLWPVLAPPSEVTAWIALDDVDESNGCMSMVPGSHLWGDALQFMVQNITSFDDLPAEYLGHRVEAVLRPVRKGDVHFHHGLTWHGSHANTSGRPRRAIAVHYMTQETTYVASGNHVMKSFITVEDGAKLEGESFPLVWSASTAGALA